MQQRLFLAALGHAYQSLHYVNKVTQERQSGEGKKMEITFKDRRRVVANKQISQHGCVFTCPQRKQSLQANIAFCLKFNLVIKTINRFFNSSRFKISKEKTRFLRFYKRDKSKYNFRL